MKKSLLCIFSLSLVANTASASVGMAVFCAHIIGQAGGIFLLKHMSDKNIVSQVRLQPETQRRLLSHAQKHQQPQAPSPTQKIPQISRTCLNMLFLKD